MCTVANLQHVLLYNNQSDLHGKSLYHLTLQRYSPVPDFPKLTRSQPRFLSNNVYALFSDTYTYSQLINRSHSKCGNTRYQFTYPKKLHKCTLPLYALQTSLFSFLPFSLVTVHCYKTPEERWVVAWTWNVITDLYTFNLKYSQKSYCNGMPHMFQGKIN